MGRYCTFTKNIEQREDLFGLTYHLRDVYPAFDISQPPNIMQFLEQNDLQDEHDFAEPKTDEAM